MLLALKPPNPMQNEIKTHEYSTFKSTPSRYSPPPSPRNLPSFFDDNRMSNPHRGLPLPAGLSLPPPDRGSSTASTLGHLPAPPSQWAGQDESMRSWLHAKAEEDRRKQEEEKTRQEGLRLDQRRVEQTMLRESLQGGIPPPMVPLIFAGLGGGNLPGHTLEWAQQYMASLSLQNQQQQQQIQVQQQQLQQQQQQQQIQQQQPQPPPPPPPPSQSQISPDMRRDNRMVPPNSYGVQQQQAQQQLQPAQPTQSLNSQNTQLSIPRTGTRSPIGSSSQGPSTLSRLNTTEFVPAPTSSQNTRQVGHPLQQSQTAPSEQSSGPGLFFHHWTPPNPSNNNAPTTPSGKSNQGSPFSQSATSHLRSEYQNSPKKRKAAGSHPPPPPPTSQAERSPAYSNRSSPRERDTSPGQGKDTERLRQHSRQHSNASSREQESRNIARPSSRQQRQDELSGAGGPPKRQLTGSSSSGSSEDNNNNTTSSRYEGVKSETQ